MSQANKLRVERFVSTLLDCNLYLLENDAGQVIIDPSVEYDVVYNNRNENLKAIILTHCHFDHIWAIASYLEKTDCPIILHEAGLEKLSDPKKNASTVLDLELFFSIPEERVKTINGECHFNLLGTDFHFLVTPGHTNCSLSIIAEDYMFTGDTLFKGTIGRTDLVSSRGQDMLRSLEKLVSLEKDYLIYPGHGEETSLEAERKTNPYLRRWTHV